jgi:hypothetical protein
LRPASVCAYRHFFSNKKSDPLAAAGGDRKKAVERLRAHDQKRTFHSGMFQSGLMLGLALPALIGGIYDSALPAFCHST